MRNLMNDIQGGNESSAGGSPSQLRKERSFLGSSSSLISTNQDEFELMKNDVMQIQNACHQIERLYNIKRSGTPAQQKKALQKQDQMIVKTNHKIRQVKKSMEAAKRKHLLNKSKNTQTHNVMFENKFNSIAQRYQAAILKYQSMTDKFKNAVESDFTRKAKIVNPHISNIQIQKMMDSNDPGQYLQTHIMAISPALLDEVAELEEEHDRVKKFEKSIKEIQELFNACAVLVIEAGEKLDQIEVNVGQTLEAAEKGKREVNKAEVYAIQTRKTKIKTAAAGICCILIALVLLLYVCGAFKSDEKDLLDLKLEW